MSDIDDRLDRGGEAVRRMAAGVPMATSNRLFDGGGSKLRWQVATIAATSLTLVAAITATFLFLGPDRESDVVGPGVTTTSVALSDTDLRVFLASSTTDDELTQAVAEAMTWPGVINAHAFDSDAAFAEFSEIFAGCPDLVEAASHDLNAFPPSVGLWVEDGTDIDSLAETARVALAGFGPVTVEVTAHAPSAQDGCVSPTTTMPVPSQLERAGTDLQNEITADGYVSRDEFVRAVAGMAACMTEHGLTGVTWSVDDHGEGWDIGYESPTGDAAEQAIYALCYYSYIPQELLRGEAPTPEDATLYPVRITCAGEVSFEMSESYPCSALIDGDPTTTWQAPDGGIGVTITFLFAEPVQITDLAFENEPGDAYVRNIRVRGVVMTADDLSQPIAFELIDTNTAPQVVDIRSLRTSTLTLQITSGYPGQSVGDQAPFTDVAIGEISLRGRPAPEAVGTSNWLGTGESIADDVLLALRPPQEPIPGTAIRLAWTSAYNGEYDLGLFAFMATPAEQVSSAQVWYCLTEIGLLAGSGTVVVGGSQCSLTLEQFHEQLAFGSSGGGSCVEPLTLMTTIWGIPERVGTVTFYMSDGTELVGEVTHGIVQVAWGRDIVVTSATFAGITEEQALKLSQHYDFAQRTCAEANGSGNG